MGKQHCTHAACVTFAVPGAVIFGELVSAGKRTLSRVLVIIVSVGYGIVKSVVFCLSVTVARVILCKSVPCMGAEGQRGPGERLAKRTVKHVN